MEKKQPEWLTIGDDSVTIRLTKPTTMNGVSVDRITMRAPTVGDMRGAAKMAPNDKEEQELVLFASLAGVGKNDIEALRLKDYNRLQEGYFRLLSDGEG